MSTTTVEKSAAPTTPPTKKYVWREGARFGAQDPQIVGQTLAVIEMNNRGCKDLDQKIVDAARLPSSPIHSYFDWSDSVAAKKWRQEQAALLRRSIKVVITQAGAPSKMIQLPIFTSETKFGSREKGSFFPTDDGMKTPSLRQHILQRALDEARAFMNKYQTLSGVQPIIKSIQSVLAKHAAKAKKKSTKKPKARKQVKKKRPKKKKP